MNELAEGFKSSNKLNELRIDWTYWILFHILAWAIYGGIYLYDVLQSSKPDNYWQVAVFAALSGNIISLLMHFCYQRLKAHSLFRKVIWVLLLCVLFAMTWSLIRSTYFNFIYESNLPDKLYFSYQSVMHHFNPLIIWSVFYFLYDINKSLIDNKMNALKSESLAHENQLKLLSYHLNPHFLFNVLNSIGSMVLKHNDMTLYKTIGGLSDFLRYTLESEPWKKVKIAQEIQCITQYLDIQKVRYNDKLLFDFDVPESLNSALIPHLLLLPLIENAIKHTIACGADQVNINCSVTQIQATNLLVEITNSIDVSTDVSDQQIGLGIENVINRLQVYYENHATVDISNSKKQYMVSIMIPFET